MKVYLKKLFLIFTTAVLLVVIVSCGNVTEILNERTDNNLEVNSQSTLLKEFKFKPGISSIDLDNVTIDGLSFNQYDKKTELHNLCNEYMRNGSFYSQTEMNEICRKINNHVEEYKRIIINKSGNENITIEEAKNIVK